MNVDDFLVRYSTTTKRPGDLDPVFDNNLGDDLITVWEGPLTFSTEATGPPGGPRGFDYYFPFQTPFFYDPTSGRNLLVDVISISGYSADLLTDDFTGTSPMIVFGGATADAGEVLNSGGLVAQFVFVPEPLLGDLNLDGEVNGLDVDPFVDVLLSGPYQPEADMNEDQVVNGLDVDPFVAAVVGGSAQEIPEPSTLLLTLVALGVVGGSWKYERRGAWPCGAHRGLA